MRERSEVDTDPPLPTPHEYICNHLYLTPPGKLLNNQTLQAQPPCETRAHAINVPLQYTTAHIQDTWELWVGVRTTHSSRRISSSERQRAGNVEMFATSKTDRVLDEYAKTVPPEVATPFQADYDTSSLTPDQCIERGKKELRAVHAQRKHKALQIQDSHSSRDNIQNTPPMLLHTAAHKRQASISQHKHRSRTGWGHPALQRSKVRISHYPPYPHRLSALQPHSANPAGTLMTTTVPSPLQTACALSEALELHLESMLPTQLKSNDYKHRVRAIQMIVRKVVSRGGIIREWLNEVREGKLDMIDVTPTMDVLSRRFAYEYMTLRRMEAEFFDHADFLCRTEAEKHCLIMLTQIARPRSAIASVPTTSTQLNPSWLLRLKENFHVSHSVESTRQEIVRRILPTSMSTAAVHDYSNRYEQLVRVQTMSLAAFRKDNSVLSVMFALHNFPVRHAERLPETVRSATKPPTRRRLPRTKTVHLSLNASDRVPQKINVKLKKYTKSRSSPKNTAMKNAALTDTPSLAQIHARPPSSTTDGSTTAVAAPSSKTKNKSKTKPTGGGAKTLTITTTAAPASSAALKNLAKTPTVIHSSKSSNASKRYLTSDEVHTYRTGLQNHIKKQGGAAFIQQQQSLQGKRNPAFHFDAVVADSDTHYSSIKDKLQLSAKNRNKLRRVKRMVLKSFGGSHRTCKQIKKAQRDSNTDHHGCHANYKGSMYTRKHAGGKSVAPSNFRVTWKDSDSLGNKLRDESANDMKATEGLSTIDLTNLEEVVID